METKNIMNTIDRYRQHQRISIEHFVEGIMTMRSYRRLLIGEQSLSLNKLELLTNRLGLNIQSILTEIYGNNENDKIKIIVESIIDYDQVYKNYQDSISETNMQISEMINNHKSERYHKFYNRLLFVSLFSTLECYLKDTIVFLVSNEIGSAYAIVEEIPSLKSKKISLSDIRNFNITDEIISVLQNTSFHKFGDTDKYYNRILSEDFDLLNTFNEYVMIRHNIIHRNKRDIDGNEVIITNNNLIEFLRKISAKVDLIHRYIQREVLKLQEVIK